jgi:hypothetical protein
MLSWLPRGLSWVLLFVLSLSSLAIVFIPAWIIMPFKSQSERGIEVSYVLRRWSPLLTIIALALILALVVVLWRVSRGWWRKAALILALGISIVPAWFARQNHFEWMFNPIRNPLYARVDEADFVDDSDMVLTVENNGESVAYPVRQLAYHHLVRDTVGGAAIVATY